jgi:hypothetical protein
VAKLYPRALGSLSVASYDSRGLLWRYSNRPPHRVTTIRGYTDTSLLRYGPIENGASNNSSIVAFVATETNLLIRCLAMIFRDIRVHIDTQTDKRDLWIYEVLR